MNVPFLDLKAQYQSIKEEVNQEIQGVLDRCDFIMGGSVAALEEEFAAYCGAEHAVGVDSGLSALEVLLRAYNIGAGDEVITAANTFIATALAISSVGAKPVLVDCDDSFNIDPSLIEAAITERTKAIMPVHLYGMPADMNAISEVAKRHNLLVLEDAAQAHGAYYHDKRPGNLADGAAFSFYPGKNLGAYGDAGMAVTNNAEVAERMKLYRNYGSKQKYYHEITGSNRRLDTMQAAILRVKLRNLDDWNNGRRANAALYTELINAEGVTTPAEPEDRKGVYHLYVIRTAYRDAMQEALKEKGITTIIHYPIAIHEQEAYKDLGYKQGDFPVTERMVKEILSLPMYAELSEEMVRYTAESVNEFATSVNMMDQREAVSGD